jgi:drug/metabolite transporter (DMT)-like permease
MEPAANRVWPAVLAALSGSTMVGVMPLIARRLYADGLGAPSMLFFRYVFAVLALVIASGAVRLDLRQAWRGGAWRIGLLGATLGSAQTLCFWQSLQTLETSIAVLLFYTYPAITLALERLVFRLAIRPLAVGCIGAILCGAALITGPGLKGGTIDLRGLAWALPSPLIYAAYLAINTRLLRHYPPMIGALGLFSGMAVTFAIAVALTGIEVPSAAWGWALLVFIGVGPGAVTMTLFSFAVPRLGASSYAILANMELVTVVALGVLVLGEAVTINRAAGAALIVGGILTHALSRQKTAQPGPLPARGARGERESAGKPIPQGFLSPFTGKGTG